MEQVLPTHPQAVAIAEYCPNVVSARWEGFAAIVHSRARAISQAEVADASDGAAKLDTDKALLY